MVMPTFILWDAGYSIYTYGSIFIIALIIWQVKKNHQKLSLGTNKSCCQRHRRVKQRWRDRRSRAKRTSKEEAEKLKKLLSVMKSQGWLPQVEGVRQLLCSDPCCQTCNAVALEIQQLLEGENNQVCPALLGTSQGSSCLEMSTSSVSFDPSQDLGSQNSRKIPLASSSMLSQLMGQKSLTQSATQSSGSVGVQDHQWPDHLLHGKKSQVSDKSWDMGARSSSHKEPGIPVNQEKRKKQDTLELDMGDKMTLFSHWINPEVNDQRHEDPILFCKAETVAKSRKEAGEDPSPNKDHVRKGSLKNTTKDPTAHPSSTKKEHLTFFDAPSYSNTPFSSATSSTTPSSVLN